MKKFIIFIAFLIFIPFFIVKIYNNNYKEIKLNYTNNAIVKVKRQKSGIIEYIPLEEYIVGVLAGEMPINFEIEALKAQAVASRSYVLARISDKNEYDVVDSIMNQVYLDDDYLKNAWGKNYVKNINKLRKVVNETIDEYLEYDGKVVNAMFFSTSNGYTENSKDIFGFDSSYLKSVSSPWDKYTSSVFKSTKKIDLISFYNKLNLPFNKNLNIKIISKTKSGRVLSLKINNSIFKGNDIYNKLSLKSLDFDIIFMGDYVDIKTYGYGHGVGMSQYGALGMAKEGFSYEEILKYYYSGVQIKKINNLV